MTAVKVARGLRMGGRSQAQSVGARLSQQVSHDSSAGSWPPDNTLDTFCSCIACISLQPLLLPAAFLCPHPMARAGRAAPCWGALIFLASVTQVTYNESKRKCCQIDSGCLLPFAHGYGLLAFYQSCFNHSFIFRGLIFLYTHCLQQS